MAYITLEESKQFLGDKYLSAYININTDLVDDTILQSDIDDATSLIDSYVMQAYDKTITGTEALNILRSIAKQLVNYYCYQRYDSSEVPDSVIADYDRSIFRLKDIANGTNRFIDETQDSRGSSFSYQYNSANPDGTGRKVFDRDSMAGY